MTENFADIIRILNIPGIGPRRTADLYKKFGSLENIFTASTKSLIQLPGITSKVAAAIHKPLDKEVLSGQTYLIEKFDVKVISLWDDEYPALLREIYDPPIALFCRGDLSLFDSKCLGIVGTRTPTAYGKEVTTEFTSALVEQGYTIVSGAAKGVDTLAHRSALNNNGKTIAVLGNGIDRVYPAENRLLYKDLANEGLIVSEFLMGSKPDAQNFPRRNRIISGLATGIVVMEAAEKSGSLITAYFALDQNREVFAVPGSVLSKQSKGTNHLIRQGATLVDSVPAILDELGDRYRLGASGGQQELMVSNDPKETEIIRLIPENDTIQIDDLAQACGQTTFALLGLLLQMEMKGLIQQLPGKYFKRR